MSLKRMLVTTATNPAALISHAGETPLQAGDSDLGIADPSAVNGSPSVDKSIAKAVWADQIETFPCPAS